MSGPSDRAAGGGQCPGAPERRPIRVAVIGGGCAAMTAAFELTRPEHQGRYELTVYQMGWRLGGKGASGRGPSARIEEHGLHLWLGFYENAFRIMRECYAELGREVGKHPIAAWQDAFEPAPVVGVIECRAGGGWEPWIAHFPKGVGLPGDPEQPRAPFSVRSYMEQAVALLVELMRSAYAGGAARKEPVGGAIGLDDLLSAADRLLRFGQLATAAAVFEATNILKASMDVLFPAAWRSDGVALRLIDALAAAARRTLGSIVAGDAELRRVWQVIDLILAVLRGATVCGLALDPRGFDAINDQDWRQWLRKHGATDESLDSAFMRGIYDLVFAYEAGDVSRPSLAAGVALRGAMRMFFTSRGALFWRMTAGMGDVVFAPLYEVLRRRGVRFEFFHQLREVGLSERATAEDRHVTSLRFDVQAIVRSGEYQPLVEIKGVPCWPSEPDWAQLEGGAAASRQGIAFEAPWESRRVGEKILRVGDDFDLVILGVGVAVLSEVCSALIAAEPRWRAMIETAATVATQAFQVWLREDYASLGWAHPGVSLSGYVEPFDTWADMTHLGPREACAEPVRAIGYFCSALPDGIPRGRPVDREVWEGARAEVRRNAIRFLERDAGALWPGAVDRTRGFRWDLLAADGPGDEAGSERFDTQYWTANVNPSDRYSLSLPGTLQHRISPLDRDFDNLTVCGDWTQTGLDSGCVESAVISGRLAAHALCGAPRLEEIVGYDHP